MMGVTYVGRQHVDLMGSRPVVCSAVEAAEPVRLGVVWREVQVTHPLEGPKVWTMTRGDRDAH